MIHCSLYKNEPTELEELSSLLKLRLFDVVLCSLLGLSNFALISPTSCVTWFCIWLLIASLTVRNISSWRTGLQGQAISLQPHLHAIKLQFLRAPNFFQWFRWLIQTIQIYKLLLLIMHSLKPANIYACCLARHFDTSALLWVLRKKKEKKSKYTTKRIHFALIKAANIEPGLTDNGYTLEAPLLFQIDFPAWKM